MEGNNVAECLKVLPETFKSQDVLVYVYADWCGHCKNFTPVWKDFVTKHNLGHAAVMINEKVYPQFKSLLDHPVYGFPSLFMRRVGKDGEVSYVDFDSTRTSESLHAFVQQFKKEGGGGGGGGGKTGPKKSKKKDSRKKPKSKRNKK